MPKCISGWCSALASAGGAHSAPLDPLVGWKGDTGDGSPAFGARHENSHGTLVWGAAPKYFPLEQHMMEQEHLTLLIFYY